MNRLLGEWLNGRATVSKTVGCVFESRLPCQRRHMALLASARSARLRAFCFQACVSFSPRENATTHHAPRFQLSRVSLIFAPRNFFHARTTPPRFITPETPLREHERRFLFYRESGDNTHFRCFATNLPQTNRVSPASVATWHRSQAPAPQGCGRFAFHRPIYYTSATVISQVRPRARSRSRSVRAYPFRAGSVTCTRTATSSKNKSQTRRKDAPTEKRKTRKAGLFRNRQLLYRRFGIVAV